MKNDRKISYRIAIGLLGKGSTNHLHRKEIVDAFRAMDVDVSFVVRHDYLPLLKKIDGCRYFDAEFKSLNGWKASLSFVCSFIRYVYPSWDEGRQVNLPPPRTLPVRTRVFQRICLALAHFRIVVEAAARIEQRIFKASMVQGMNPNLMDQMLLLGVGTVDSELEGLMTQWARHHHIPVVHLVGNYDNLSSKGYRGVPIDRLLVWGPSMRNDAVKLHGISEKRISAIGSIRYNTMPSLLRHDKKAFLTSIGMDPDRKTILFAGFVFPFHYFEVLEVYEQLLKDGVNCQLILRIYPNKNLMNSVYIKPLGVYAQKLPHVYVSIGDPNYQSGQRNREVLQIEEYELSNALNCCDLVINQYSTISIEACMFDKPALNMWYFPPADPALLAGPVYKDYSKLYHNRRMMSYGAVRNAQSRQELLDMIKHELANPSKLSEKRKHVVEAEIGVLDGRACERLVASCMDMYRDSAVKKGETGRFRLTGK